MAMRRRGDRSGTVLIWPGFVDAMTALLLVLMFVLSIFMIVQFVLSEELSGKDRSLEALASQIRTLQEDLGAARADRDRALDEISGLEDLLAGERAKAIELAASLESKTEEAASLKVELAAVAATLAERDTAFAALEKRAAADAAALAEIQDEAKRIAAIEAENVALKKSVEQFEASNLTLEERVAALELALDAKRAEAEETLLLLAAAEAKKRDLELASEESLKKLSDRERANAFARAILQSEREISAKSRLAVELLNQQIRVLRARIASLDDKLRESEKRTEESKAVIENLGARLNAALAERVDELQRFRSEFFGRMREVLRNRGGIRVVGDRFVFQSEVLFGSGSATLGAAGKLELSKLADVLRDISKEIPPELNWLLRIDGHTDNVPVGPSSEFSGNWELSAARAISVITFLIEEEGIPPARLAAAGFGEHHPLEPNANAEAKARNRRIEFKLTER